MCASKYAPTGVPSGRGTGVADAPQLVADRSCRRGRCGAALPRADGRRRTRPSPSSPARSACPPRSSIPRPRSAPRSRCRGRSACARPRGRRARRSCRRTSRPWAGCRCGCRRPPADVSGRGRRGARRCCRSCRSLTSSPAARNQATTWSRPWRSRSVSAMRRTPPSGVAPIAARSISERQRRSPSMRTPAIVPASRVVESFMAASRESTRGSRRPSARAPARSR